MLTVQLVPLVLIPPSQVLLVQLLVRVMPEQRAPKVRPEQTVLLAQSEMLAQQVLLVPLVLIAMLETAVLQVSSAATVELVRYTPTVVDSMLDDSSMSSAMSWTRFNSSA